MAELAGTVLPRLSKLIKRDVRRVPDGGQTGGGGNHIFLEKRFADLLEPLKFRPRLVSKQAQAIYYLLHELRHTNQRGEYKYPESELDANHWAAQNFRWFCMNKLKFTKQQTTKLWDSLPPYWQRPKSVAK